MPRIPYSISRMLCHILIGFIGGTLFLKSAGASHSVQTLGEAEAIAPAERMPTPTVWPLVRP